MAKLSKSQRKVLEEIVQHTTKVRGKEKGTVKKRMEDLGESYDRRMLAALQKKGLIDHRADTVRGDGWAATREGVAAVSPQEEEAAIGRGGKRKGAGRKALPPGEKKVMVSVKLKPQIRTYLAAQGNATATIESAIEGTKRYREWAKSKPPYF